MTRHTLAVVAALAAIVLVTALWLVHLRLGPPLDGWVAGPTFLAVPIVLLIFVLVWLPVRALLARTGRATLAWIALVPAAGLIVVITVTCGPVACYLPGPNRMIGLFVIAGAVLVAAIHHLVLTARRRPPPTA